MISIFSYTVIIYPIVALKGAGSLYYGSAVTAAYILFASKVEFYLLLIIPRH